jgi:hypothetical protein
VSSGRRVFAYGSSRVVVEQAEVTVRNVTTSRQVFQFALYGTIKILEE